MRNYKTLNVLIYVLNKVHKLELLQIIFILIRMILNEDWRNLEEEKVLYVTFSELSPKIVQISFGPNYDKGRRENYVKGGDFLDKSTTDNFIPVGH